MKRLVLVLAVLWSALSSASAWPYIAVYTPGGVQMVPATSNPPAPLIGRFHNGSRAVEHAVTTSSPYVGYVPGHPVRNLMHASVRYYSVR
jgi:hypothetical protein